MSSRPGFLIAARRRPHGVAWTVGILALAAVAAGVVLARNAARPEPELEAAEQALQRNDPAAARSCLDRCLARWPDEPRALLLAARAARRSDACADAERFLAAFENVSGPTPASRLEWALLGAQQGDLIGVEQRLQALVSQDGPEAPEVVEALAKGYAVTFRTPEALVLLHWLLDRSPDHVPALLLRGKLLDYQRQSDAAAEDLRRAVELAPDNPAAHAELAGVLNHLGRTREAIYHYELARRSRPADPAVLLGLARALADDAEVDEAEHRLDDLLAAEPDAADALVERGRLTHRQGHEAEAEPFLARAVRVAPWHRAGQRIYLAVLNDLGRKEEASRVEAKLAELTAEDGLGGRLKLRAHDSPDNAAVRWELWQWSVRNGQAEEGFAWLAQLLRLNPQHPQTQRAMADHFEHAGQPLRAAQHRAAAGPGTDGGVDHG
jgi:predicted Zn-dependent protease